MRWWLGIGPVLHRTHVAEACWPRLALPFGPRLRVVARAKSHCHLPQDPGAPVHCNRNDLCIDHLLFHLQLLLPYFAGCGERSHFIARLCVLNSQASARRAPRAWPRAHSLGSTLGDSRRPGLAPKLSMSGLLSPSLSVSLCYAVDSCSVGQDRSYDGTSAPTPGVQMSLEEEGAVLLSIS